MRTYDVSARDKVRTFVRNVRRRLKALDKRRIRERITRILETSQCPDTGKAEDKFTELQERFPPRPEYGYDAVSTWKRASLRSHTLIGLDGIGIPGKRLLDVGAGDGMLGVALNAFGHSTTLLDQDDWRDPRARNLTFMKADCCARIPFPDNTFDLVCSYNCFEHLSHPGVALQEMVRVVRPHGLIHLEFGPIFASPLGLHAYRMLRMPYPQYLFSDEFIGRILSETGIWDLGKKQTELQPVNKMRIGEFEELWKRSGCTVVDHRVGIDESGLPLIFEFPEAFSERGLTYEDLVSNDITVTLRKP